MESLSGKPFGIVAVTLASVNICVPNHRYINPNPTAKP